MNFLLVAALALPVFTAETSEWISAVDAPVVLASPTNFPPAAEGTSWFLSAVVPEKKVVKATWTTSGMGVYEIYVNGQRIGTDVLKPGFTSCYRTRRAFSYDVTPAFACMPGATNILAAEVSSGWWRDRIVRNSYKKKSGFRGELELTYADGAVQRLGTNCRDWKASGKAGPVRSAGIFEGEVCDARQDAPSWGEAALAAPERNREFSGEILPSEGGEVCFRDDLAMCPVEAYRWKGVTGEDRRNAKNPVFGKVIRTWTAAKPEGPLEVLPGETLVVDFGQNCAAVPSFVFSAEAGTRLTCLPAEMLNDANGERSRGNDGPAGSIYRANLRSSTNMMCAVYTFRGLGGCGERYRPRFTFFGYRYVSITATARVQIHSLRSVPVTSITREMELGKIETGDKDVNRLIANVYWGQLSNYLSVPTDCPQRDERRGWTADTQVFTEAGTYNADTAAFMRKWMRDVRDSMSAGGAFPDVAPGGTWGCRVGWSDAGVIVPWTIWRQFGDTRIVEENFVAMEKWMTLLDKTGYRNKPMDFQFADWLSFEDFESWLWRARNGTKRERPKEMLAYWDYLGGCYWIHDAKLMREMAAAIGKADAAARYAKTEADARASVRERFLDAEGQLPAYLRKMQTPYVMALKMGLFRNECERQAGAEALVANIRANGNRISTGFLGTSFIMDALTESGHPEVAYDLLLQHENPSWLHSVDQGATTIWERWDGYTKKNGFGPVGMNSFNHYAYGAVLAWLYKYAAGIGADSSAPGFRKIRLAPKPDKRLGFVKAEYKSAAGLVKSAWRYEKGEKWIWEFTIPAGATACVIQPGAIQEKIYQSGTYRIER